MPEGRSRVRATRLRGYEARIAQLSEAFNLPPGMPEFVTLSMRDGKVEAKVGATASTTTTSVDVDAPANLRNALKELLAANREELHLALKRDLAMNLLAAMSDPRTGEDD
jgi:hypothetical protein